MRSFLLVAMAAGCACGPAPELDAGIDAGHDAGTPRDAQGRDGSPRDAPRDVPIDTGIEAGPEDPVWIDMPGFPPECQVQRAVHPERVYQGDYRPCGGDAPPSCLRSSEPHALIAGGFSSEGPWVWGLAPRETEDAPAIAFLAPFGEPAIAAWRAPRFVPGVSTCGIGAFALSETRAGFRVQLSRASDDLRENHIFAGPHREVGRLERASFVLSGAFVEGRTIEELRVSDSLVVFQMSPDGGLWSWRDGTFTNLARPWPGLPQNLHLVGDHVLFSIWRDPVVLGHVTPETVPPAIWRDVAPGDAKSFGTDGVDLAWLEGYDRQPDLRYARLELWTAPYRRDLENIEPRRVRDFPLRIEASVGGGWYAISRYEPLPQHVELYSLRDGSRRDFVPPGAPVGVGDPLFVSTHALLVRTADAFFFVDPGELPVVPE